MTLTPAEQAKQKVELRKKPDRREYNRQWHIANREYVRSYHRAYQRNRRYGLTDETWQELFKSQGCKCACCGTAEAAWHTDHNHQTNALRGILCRQCNTAIGMLGDTAEGVQKAVEYLRRTEASGGKREEETAGSSPNR